jgi:hypothetical protein
MYATHAPRPPREGPAAMRPLAGFVTQISDNRLGDTPESLFHPGCADQHGEYTRCECRSRQERRVSAGIHRGKIKTTCELLPFV